MNTTRRQFLALAARAGALPLLLPRDQTLLDSPPPDPGSLDAQLDRAAARPVLNLEGLKDPVVIESIELLRKGREYFLRVRPEAGAVGIALDNGRAEVLQPILHRLIIPCFIGRDARELEEHLFGVYFEGLCPFDDFDQTKKVTDALTVPRGPGVGIANPGELLQRAEVVKP